MSHNMVPLPARPHKVALYLQHLGQKTKSRSPVEEACNSGCMHVQDWLHHHHTHLLRGLQREYAKPRVKKEPLTCVLERIVEDAEKSKSLSDLRLAPACLLGFAGFLCFEELIS